MKAVILLRLALVIVLLAFVSGCEQMETARQTATRAVYAVMPRPSGYWNGDDVSGSPKIVVHLAEQKAYFYKGKHLVGESTVSTGKRGFGTPVGHYHVVSKDRDHVSSEFGDYVDDAGNVLKSNIDVRKDSKPRGAHFDGARMPYCMHFNGGYAMHQVMFRHTPRHMVASDCPKEWPNISSTPPTKARP